MQPINGRDGVLVIDSADRSAEATSWAFGPGKKQTFAQMRGQIPTVLNMTILQDLTTDSLWDLAVNQAGTAVACIYKPYGNAVASSAKPHYGFNATPSGPTGDTILGGDAAEDGTQGLTVDVVWQIDTWTKITASA